MGINRAFSVCCHLKTSWEKKKNNWSEPKFFVQPQNYVKLRPVEDNEIAHVDEAMPMCKASKDQGLFAVLHLAKPLRAFGLQL